MGRQEEGVIKFTVPESVNVERVKGLLCSAFEGGSNYWYMDLDVHQWPDGVSSRERVDAHIYDWHTEVPVVEGGVLSLVDKYEGDEHLLDLAKITKGLAIMREKYPRHWSNFATENDDAETADVFLQCCVFDDIIYG